MIRSRSSQGSFPQFSSMVGRLIHPMSLVPWKLYQLEIHRIVTAALYLSVCPTIQLVMKPP